MCDGLARVGMQWAGSASVGTRLQRAEELPDHAGLGHAVLVHQQHMAGTLGSGPGDAVVLGAPYSQVVLHAQHGIDLWSRSLAPRSQVGSRGVVHNDQARHLRPQGLDLRQQRRKLGLKSHHHCHNERREQGHGLLQKEVRLDIGRGLPHRRALGHAERSRRQSRA